MTCEYCSGPIVQASGHQGRPKSRFCSRTCLERWRARDRRAAAVRAAGDRRCAECQTPIAADVTLKARFCSRTCMYSFQNRERATAAKALVLAGRQPCKQCGGPIAEGKRGGTLYCSRECKKRANDIAWRERSPGYNRQYLYGVTPEAWDAQLAAQDGRCAICRSSEWPGKGNWPHTDHDHATKRFRGILCGNCNNGLGYFGDDPARLRAAAEYLERARA